MLALALTLALFYVELAGVFASLTVPELQSCKYKTSTMLCMVLSNAISLTSVSVRVSVRKQIESVRLS